jgi:hypothetical protein
MEEVDEKVSAQTRMKMKQAFKKSASKRKIGMKKALNKPASPEKLKGMAMKKARDMIAAKILKNKDKSDLGFAAKDKLEKQLNKKKAVIAKLAKKILPKVKSDNKEKVAKHKASK